MSVTVKLTKIKPYVRMHYIMTHTAKELEETMIKLGEADDDKKAYRIIHQRGDESDSVFARNFL